MPSSVTRARGGISSHQASGFSEDVSLARGLSELESTILEKPFTPAALARKIRAVLESA